MKLLLLFSLFLFINNLRAQILTREECSNSDIINSNSLIRQNKELRNHFLKPRNQDSIGWCYGFSAADLLSAELGTPISSIHVSTYFNKRARKNIFYRLGFGISRPYTDNAFNEVYEGGISKMAINEVVKSGKVCREKDLPFDRNFEEQTLFMIRDFERIRKNRKELEKEDPNCHFTQSYLSKNNLLGNAQEISEEIYKNNMNIAMEKIVSKQCERSYVSVPKLTVKKISTTSSKNKSKAKKFLNQFNQQIESGRPIEIGYNVKDVVDNNSGMHSNIVTARRWHNGKCQYKVRNSWGKTCSPYKSGIECDYESGSFWLDDKQLVDFTKSASYISK